VQAVVGRLWMGRAKLQSLREDPPSEPRRVPIILRCAFGQVPGVYQIGEV
jgi:hypothetical protein